MRRAALVTVLVLGFVAAPRLRAQETAGGNAEIARQLEALHKQLAAQSDAIEELQKKVDDVLWFERVADVAEVDKVYLPTVPVPKEEAVYGIANERHPFRMWTYVFVPRGLDRTRKHPLLLLPHGGVHADFDTYHTHVIRELMGQGYVVVAPEYRGSTGYGREYREAIDYGGLEVDDVIAARDWALASYGFCDPARVGIVGWSHGGLIALLAAFDHPDKLQVAYAGVPVSDLVARLGYQSEEYRRLFSAPYHIGKRVDEAVDEYRRRSPVTHVAKLRIPLLVHTTTNDRDVNVLEVQELIAALSAAGKTFEYKVYADAPGGHSFNRMDSALAHESRDEIYRFLARQLRPQM
jgi:dipeptidyl aminopeptidase/acylaminoacyl peptidase